MSWQSWTPVGPSHAGIPAKSPVFDLYRSEYDGYNFTHFSEALSEERDISLSDETVRFPTPTSSSLEMARCAAQASARNGR